MDQKLIERYREKATSTAVKSTMTESIILVYGPYGAGKTLLALTASKLFAGFPNKGERIFCDDLCVIQVDPAATDGYKSIGYDCHVIRYREILAEVKHPETAMEIAIALAKETGAKYFVLDTVSQYDIDALGYLNENPELYSTNAGFVDTRKMWGQLKEAHRKTYTRFMELPGVKLALAHATALVDDLQFEKDDQKEARLRKEKVAMPGNPSIVPKITGASKDVWMGANSLQVYLRVTELPGGKGLNRVLETEYKGTVDAATKNRFSHLIGINPEFNLAKLIEQIRA